MVKLVAEIGANHHQDYRKAKALVYAASDAGADAVKVQIFEPGKMTFNSEAEHFIAEKPWEGTSLYNLYKRAALPLEWVEGLKALAEEIGIEFIVSVYYPEILKFTERLGVRTYKIASFEINYIDLLRAVAKTKKPVIVSTGTADFDEIKRAVAICDHVTLLKCASAYPAPYNSMNLLTIPDMKRVFGVPVGLSDHTTGYITAVMAATLGASVIEKHLTLDGKGLDGSFSITPEQFSVMVKVVRVAEEVLGKVSYKGIKKYRRAMVAAEDIPKGKKLEGKVAALRTVPEGKMTVPKYAGRNYLKGEMI